MKISLKHVIFIDSTTNDNIESRDHLHLSEYSIKHTLHFAWISDDNSQYQEQARKRKVSTELAKVKHIVILH